MVFGTKITLSGAITSDGAKCAQAGTTVEILKREADTTEFEHLAYTTTGVDGIFGHSVTPEVSSIYVAAVPSHTPCDEASSSPVTVLVKPLIRIKSPTTTVEAGRRFWITGTVLPEHQLTPVTLWRKKGPGEFEKLGADQLDGASRYSFAVKYVWKRVEQTFFVRWKTTDADHVSSRSVGLLIKRAS